MLVYQRVVSFRECKTVLTSTFTNQPAVSFRDPPWVYPRMVVAPVEGSGWRFFPSGPYFPQWDSLVYFPMGKKCAKVIQSWQFYTPTIGGYAVPIDWWFRFMRGVPMMARFFYLFVEELCNPLWPNFFCKDGGVFVVVWIYWSTNWHHIFRDISPPPHDSNSQWCLAFSLWRWHFSFSWELNKPSMIGGEYLGSMYHVFIPIHLQWTINRF